MNSSKNYYWLVHGKVFAKTITVECNLVHRSKEKFSNEKSLCSLYEKIVAVAAKQQFIEPADITNVVIGNVSFIGHMSDYEMYGDK